MIKCSIAIMILLNSTNALAMSCKFAWDVNPKNKNVTHYSIYKNGKMFADKIKETMYIVKCETGAYYVTASSNLGESGRSNRVMYPAVLPPKNFKVVSE